MSCIKWTCAFLFWASFFGTALAQTDTTTPDEELGRKVRAASEVQSLGDNPFGENISTYDGTLSFRQTDIDQPGSGLPLQLTRTYRTDDAWRQSALVDWKLEIPHIETLSANPNGTEDDVSTWFFLNDANRCSNFRQAPSIVLSTGGSPVPVFYLPGNWWNGYQLVIPGLGAQDLLLRDSSNTASPQMPADGGGLRNFHIVTKQNWMVSCLASTSNGKPGEGFLVVSPDGVKYWMDWLTYKRYQKVGFAQPGFGGVARRTAMMMVSRVEDRFGNSLSYSYDGNGDLKSIQASDGRKLLLTYDSWQPYGVSQSSTRIRTATLVANDSPSRTWTYNYYTADFDPLQRLTAVVQPDGSAWSFNLGGLRYTWGAAPIVVYRSSDGCVYDVNNTTSYLQGGITHPSGLAGEFNLKLVMRGRSYVPFRCTTGSAGQRSLDIANAYTVAAMNQKKISGPGVPAQVWNYSYSPANQSWASDCGSGCATSVWTDVTDPAGKAVRYTFSNRYDVSEGRLLRKDYFTGASGSSVARSEEYTYASATAGPWPTRMGVVRQPNVNNDQLEQLAPVSRNTVVQDGASFVRAVGGFDSFARPISVTKSNTISGNPARTEVTAYHDDLSLWMLGQVKSVTCTAPALCKPAWAPNGIVMSQTDYGWKALPWKTYAFGKLQQQLGYDNTSTVASGQLGTLKQVIDGRGNTTTLSGWKRGIPQLIQYPATPDQPSGESRSAVVNDDGTIASVTDENGFVTKYQYDAMGRLSVIDYPDGDTVPWTSTLRTLSFVAGAYGLPNHWRLWEQTGSGFKLTHYDALWRPVVEDTFENGNAASTRSVVVKRYDAAGRLAFQSYPLSSDQTHYADTTLKGTTYTYDALDRPLTVVQNSELGPLRTTTEYLTGFQTRVTNPRGKQTLTTLYQAFDQPTYDFPRGINHPTDANTPASFTEIYRDIFGKPTSTKRRNTDGSISVTRSYAYNTNQELCRMVEPETGATLMGYDGAGNLTWSASGLSASSACDPEGDTAAILARKAVRSYDARNRLKTLSFPNGMGDQAWTYTADNLPKTITTYNGEGHSLPVVNTYNYNKRRLLTEEHSAQTGWYDWAQGYIYNTNGHLAKHDQPGGEVIDYAPNALGQPTKAVSQLNTYATGVSYRPNGAIEQFTYGNGIVHTLTQNVRHLPDTSKDAYGSTAFLNDAYDYDGNGNVAAITDGATGRSQRGNRTMTYDGLDRLINVVSPMLGSQGAIYTYNVLDDLTRVYIGGTAARNRYYCYDAAKRLAFVRSGSVCTGAEPDPAVWALEYDVQGNLSDKNAQTFNFDYGNRLREVSGKETYRYDGHGRRITAWDIGSGKSILSMYGQDGVLRYQQDLRKGEYTNYVYLGGNLIGSRVHDAQAGTNAYRYQHTDALGSPVVVTNENRAVVERSEYEPYGYVLNRPLRDGPGYTGHVEDAATGLNYMQQRYYDPQIGRFLSIDPVAADTNTAWNFNRYNYAANNPYKFTDPDGRRINGQYHEVASSGMYHLSIRLTPDNQAAYKDDPRFLTDSATGERYATLGAGPEPTNYASFPSSPYLPIQPIFTVPTAVNLVSNINRTSDADRSTHPASNDLQVGVPSQYASEDQFIQAMFSADANYQDNVSYGLPGGGGHNSNSYANGLLQALGAAPLVAPVSTPLADRPLPKEHFER